MDDFLILNVRLKSLNATYIPVKSVPAKGESSEEGARNVLDAYDYARAKTLLNNVYDGYHNGPYLVSVHDPLTLPGSRTHIWEDLTGVAPIS